MKFNRRTPWERFLLLSSVQRFSIFPTFFLDLFKLHMLLWENGGEDQVQRKRERDGWREGKEEREINLFIYLQSNYTAKSIK